MLRSQGSFVVRSLVNKLSRVVSTPLALIRKITKLLRYKRPMDYTELADNDIPKPYQPDWKALETATGESPFMEAAFNLAKECGILSVIIANLKPASPPNFHRAVEMGMAVRLSKLMKMLVRDISNNEPYQQLGISRQMLETSGTLVYLLHDDGSGSRHTQYIQDSLMAEKQVMEQVKRNIRDRGGEVLEIEQRMERSILETAKAAGINSLDEIPARNAIGFPNFEERLKLLGGPTTYVGYRAGSAEIHGTWTDLYKYHLTHDGKTFYPNNDEPVVRPQVATTATSLLSRVLGAYLDGLEDEVALKKFDPLLTDITERNQRLVELHEVYLNKLSGDK